MAHLIKKNICLMSLISLSVLNQSLNVYAESEVSGVTENENNTITVTSFYTGNSEDDVKDPDNEFFYNDKKYKLRDYADEVIEEIPITEHVVIENIESGLPESSVKAEKNINHIYQDKYYDFKLENISYTADPLRYEDIEEIIQCTSDDEITESLNSTYTDEITGREIEIELKLQSKNVTDDYWKDFQIPMVIYGYDADYYMLSGTRFELSDDVLDISGKEQAILSYLNLDPGDYRIHSTVWDGQPYEVNGQIRRNAYAVGQRRIENIDLVYKAEKVEMPQTYTATEKYGADINTTNSFQYKHTVKAVYAPDNIAAIVKVSVFVFLFLLIIVIILFIVAKKKREKEETNNG